MVPDQSRGSHKSTHNAGFSFPTGGTRDSGEISSRGAALALGKDNVVTFLNPSNGIFLGFRGTDGGLGLSLCSRILSLMSYSLIVVLVKGSKVANLVTSLVSFFTSTRLL